MTQVIDSESGEIRYARSGGVNIAYQVTGVGVVDLVHIGGWVTHIEVAKEDPGMGPFSEALDRFARVVSCDKRGTGLSDRVPEAQLGLTPPGSPAFVPLRSPTMRSFASCCWTAWTSEI